MQHGMLSLPLSPLTPNCETDGRACQEAERLQSPPRTYYQRSTQSSASASSPSALQGKDHAPCATRPRPSIALQAGNLLGASHRSREEAATKRREEEWAVRWRCRRIAQRVCAARQTSQHASSRATRLNNMYLLSLYTTNRVSACRKPGAIQGLAPADDDQARKVRGPRAGPFRAMGRKPDPHTFSKALYGIFSSMCGTDPMQPDAPS